MTVTGPGNQTSTVGSAVSVPVHATDSASGQTLTYSASGLPAGLSINASSGVISGTPTDSRNVERHRDRHRHHRVGRIGLVQLDGQPRWRRVRHHEHRVEQAGDRVIDGERAVRPPRNAVDGNTGTRWSSAFSDPQWLQVDLGSVQAICQVVLNWEAAYATAFQIQTSADATTWTSIYSTTTGTGGVQTLTVSGSGRYIRVYGTTRATQYGYSLWEFSVYGGSGNTVTVTSPGNLTSTVGTAASVQVHATDSASGQTLTYSATGLPAGLSINASSGLISGTPTTAGSSTTVVTVRDGTGATGTTSFTWTVSGGSCGTTNLALNHTATASSQENAAFPAQDAVDGNAGTRWSSAFSDPQWLQVDLGASHSVCKVVLSWEAAYATAFQVQTSADGSTWTTVYSTTTGTGGTQTLTVAGTGRYLRVYGTARATQYGYSLWEVQAFGS